MKVTDKQTGCVLESDDKITTDAWKASPERFAVADQPAPERRSRRQAATDAGEE